MVQFARHAVVEFNLEWAVKCYHCVACDHETTTEDKIIEHLKEHKIKQLSSVFVTSGASLEGDHISHSTSFNYSNDHETAIEQDDESEEPVKEETVSLADAITEGLSQEDAADIVANDHDMAVELNLTAPKTLGNKDDTQNNEMKVIVAVGGADENDRIKNISEANVDEFFSTMIIKEKALKYMCSVCCKVLRTKKIYDHHVKQCNQEKRLNREKFFCSFCDLSFDKLLQLKRHTKLHGLNSSISSSQKEFKCVVCKVQYDSKDQLTYCLESHKGETFSCEKCPKTFPSAKELSQHFSCHVKKKKSLVCDICGMLFQFHCRLKSHLNEEHAMEEYVCQYCNKRMKSEKSLKVHTLRHEGKFQFRCETCNFGALNRSQYEIHLKTHMKKEMPKMYLCDECDKSFAKKHTLQIHKASVHEGVRHECKLCGKLYKSKEQLKVHILEYHEKKFRFTCQHCEKGFTRKREFDNHLLMHTNIKAHVCAHCNRSFTLKINLQRHVESVHDNIKYRCTHDNCNAEFASKTNLKYHLEEHQGHYRFMCNICEKGFWRSADYKKHTLSHTRD